jgi:prepilin-type N-terminal cleavage/methylation domain-containing protein
MTSSPSDPILASRRGLARGQAGFSLIELIIAMVLMIIMSTWVYALVGTGGRSLRHIGDSVQSQSQLRAAIDNVSDEIRWGAAVTAASASAVTVRVASGSPFSPGSDYAVTFAYDAAADTITRRVDPDAEGPLAAGAAVPIAHNVVRADGGAGFALEYFDATATSLGSAPAALPSIARVRMTITTLRNETERRFAADAGLRGR